MPLWNFKTMRFNSNGGAEIANLSEEQKTRIAKYMEALEVAANSAVANPSFSKYFVEESIGAVNGKMLPAGNIEYGMCQALHGEESAIAAFRSHYGRANTKKIIVGIIAENAGDIIAPCGNCRDILLDDFGKDFEIVSGARDGGMAIVVNMSHYLFSEFKKIDYSVPSEEAQNIETAIQNCESLVNDAYSPKDIHPERKYHAVISTRANNFFGARDVMCDYHPIYALRDAIRQARRAHDPFARYITILCKDFGGGAPHVMYKDRQHLLELNLQAELEIGQKYDFPVFLITYNEQKQTTGIWETSAKEWIPFPFTPNDFGPKFIEHLTRYFRTL